MILAIVGSVSLAGNQEAQDRIEEVLDRYRPTLVVSGGADGIDTMAVTAAVTRNIKIREFLPKVRRWWGPGGFKERNLHIAEACDALVRIVAHDSKTYGSGWTRDQAKKLGKPTEEYVIRRK